MNWQPHTKHPKAAERFWAVIAYQGDDGLYTLAPELYQWDGALFRGEISGERWSMAKPAALIADVWQQTADSARRFLDGMPRRFILVLLDDLRRAGRRDPNARAQADALDRHLTGKGCTDLEALALAWSVSTDLTLCSNRRVQ